MLTYSIELELGAPGEGPPEWAAGRHERENHFQHKPGTDFFKVTAVTTTTKLIGFIIAPTRNPKTAPGNTTDYFCDVKNCQATAEEAVKRLRAQPLRRFAVDEAQRGPVTLV